MDRETGSPLRFLAPLALVVFALAFLVVVVTADVSDGGNSNEDNEQAEQRDLRGERRTRRRERRQDRLPQRVYRVKEGDTIATIAEKTGVPVEKILQLNPNLDPQTLTTGQEVRLRE
jgi:hypothetical protein